MFSLWKVCMKLASLHKVLFFQLFVTPQSWWRFTSRSHGSNRLYQLFMLAPSERCSFSLSHCNIFCHIYLHRDWFTVICNSLLLGIVFKWIIYGLFPFKHRFLVTYSFINLDLMTGYINNWSIPTDALIYLFFYFLNSDFSVWLVCSMLLKHWYSDWGYAKISTWLILSICILLCYYIWFPFSSFSRILNHFLRFLFLYASTSFSWNKL